MRPECHLFDLFDGTKEMMHPCLIYLRAISLVARPPAAADLEVRDQVGLLDDRAAGRVHEHLHSRRHVAPECERNGYAKRV